MAEFVVIAGPNGSGKSFYSTDKDSALSTVYATRSFDFDYRYSELYKDFIDIMTQQLEVNLYNRVKEIFLEEAKEALAFSKSFSFQTNFDDSSTDSWRVKFEESGYSTFLTFLFLDDVELCKERVEIRVLNGGHYVDEQTISERYIKGLANFDAFFSKYNHVTMIDSSRFEEVKQLFVYSDGKVIYIDEKLIEIVSKYDLQNLKSLIAKFMNDQIG